MADVINQINQVRASFSQQTGWKEVEQQVRIDKHVFKGSIPRSTLKGDL